MEKIYKKSVFKILSGLVSGVLAAGAVGIIVGWVTDKMLYAMIAAGTVLFLFALMLWSQWKVSVSIKGDRVIFTIGKNRREYPIEECSFSSRIRDNSDFSLTVMHAGETQEYDLSFLSYGNYMDLLEELGVLGDKQDVIKVATKTKE